MEKEIIRLENISFAYDGKSRNAVDNITFQVNSGEWIALVGHNGSGKSTLAKLIVGLLQPSLGEIWVENIKLDEDSVWDIRKHVGIVFQNPDNQFVGTTVEDDVAFGLENAGIPRDEMVKRVKDSIEKVNMQSYLNHEPHQLSGGQKQRVAIAGVLALQPEIIILDEATSMLEPKGKQEVLNIIKELKLNKRMTIISITHDLEEAAQADRMIVLNKGKIFSSGDPYEIFKSKELKEIGLDLPFTVQVKRGLKDLGIELNISSKDDQNVEGMVDELCKLHSKM
ncbi:MAG: energy-coupling factor transporter ATP-binding protein [Bacillales bacterium]|nr:energy-coupling factor transporter ATP-binding protein [Bacillales bacterium]